MNKMNSYFLDPRSGVNRFYIFASFLHVSDRSVLVLAHYHGSLHHTSSYKALVIGYTFTDACTKCVPDCA